jgi:hypothetical protein
MRPTLALATAALLAAAPPALAKPDDPPQPKPKPPQLELLTRSQEAALRQRRIKIAVTSQQGRRARLEAELVVEGIPEDFYFSFPQQRKRLRGHEAKFVFKLGRRQREVLAFGEQACMRADVNAQAKVADRVETIHEHLDKSAAC